MVLVSNILQSITLKNTSKNSIIKGMCNNISMYVISVINRSIYICIIFDLMNYSLIAGSLVKSLK